MKNFILTFLVCLLLPNTITQISAQTTDTISLTLQVGEFYSSYTGAGSCLASGSYDVSQSFPTGIVYTTDEVYESDNGFIRVNYTIDIAADLNPGSYEGEVTYTIYRGTSVCSERRKLFYLEIIAAENPIVDFTAETTRLIKGGTVHFTNNTQNPVSSWFWNFGDGHTSIEFEPSHTYDSLGIFNVQLVAEGPGGNDTLIRQNYIQVVEEGSAGTLIWSYEADDEIIHTPAIGEDGTIYFSCQDGYLYALNSDGSFKWKTLLGWYSTFSPTIGNDGTIFACFKASGKLFALDTEGNIKWEYDIEQAIHSAPAIAPDNSINFISEVGTFYSISPDGTENWITHTDSVYFDEAFIAIDGSGKIYLGKANTVYCISINGTILWKWTDESFGFPRIYGLSINSEGSLLVSIPGTIYFIKDGVTKYIAKTDIDYAGPAVVSSENNCYLGSRARPSLSSYDKNGNQLWLLKFYSNSFDFYDVFCPVVGEGDIIYALNQNDTLYSVDVSGNIIWTLKMPNYIGNGYSSNPSLLINDSQLIIAGDSRHIYSVQCQSEGLANTSWPAESQNLRNTKSQLNPSPVIVYPKNGSNNIPVDTHIQWAQIFNADSFQFELDTSSTFMSEMLKSVVQADTMVMTNDLLNNTKYFVRVRAYRHGDTLNWSIHHSFKTAPDYPDKTILTLPAENSSVSMGDITLSWNPMDTVYTDLITNGGNEYPLMLLSRFPYWKSKWDDWEQYSPGLAGQFAFRDIQGNDPLIQNIEISSFDRENNPYLLAEGYSKGVEGYNYHITITFFGTSSDSSLKDSLYTFTYTSDDWEKFSILVTVPEGSERLGYSFNRSVSYYGDEPFLFDGISLYTVPEYYEVLVANDYNFNTIVANDTVIGIDSLVLNIQDNNNEYYWKVRTINVSGVGPWSDVWRFSYRKPTAIKEISDDELWLKNYPNPFSEQTNITFIIQEPQNIKLSIYNSFGELIETLVDEYRISGSHCITWDAGIHSPGVYFYRIETEEMVATKTLILF